MRRFVFLAVVCLAFPECGDSTGPESVAGRYSLVSVDGEPLPFVMQQEARTSSRSRRRTSSSTPMAPVASLAHSEPLTGGW